MTLLLMFAERMRYIREHFFDENKKQERYLSFLAKNSTGRSCDFGCGDKGQLHFLSQHTELTIGLDASKQELKKARALNLENIALVQGDCLHAPFKDDVFDVVICHHLLEHLIRPEQGMTSIRRLLRNKGYCFIKVPCLVEVLSDTFSHNPLLQVGRALVHRSLDFIYYHGKVTLACRILLRKDSGKWRLRGFFPQRYQAQTVNDNLNLNNYIDKWFEGKPIGLAHKHWFMPKEWLQILKNAGLNLVSYEGMYVFYALVQK